METQSLKTNPNASWACLERESFGLIGLTRTLCININCKQNKLQKDN